MSRRGLNPIKIHLKELPKEGRSYSYTHESGELNKALHDLIGANPYSIDITLKPVGNIFELRGQINAEMDLICSRCAYDFKYQIHEGLNEILFISEALPRSGHMSKVNHTHELEGMAPQCTELQSDFFDISEFIHEVIGLAEPTRPLGHGLCRPNCDDSTPFRLDPVKEKESPFAVLKSLKIPN